MTIVTRELSHPRRHWLVWLTAIVTIGVIALAVYVHLWTQAGTSVGDVQRTVYANLSPGASREEVVAFIDSEHWRISYSGRALDLGDPIPDEQIHPNDDLVVAVIQDAGNHLIAATDIYIYFALDRDGHLLRYFVDEVVITL